ncbi:MAG: sodium:solute symporter family protein [Dethiobacteria bacterium]|nr:sodium:solute symporter family protein [Bacillota bacterium]NMD33178.1 hypothetical protein [Bacillota bacterium]HOB29190.1 sodium:solute symporter family protein [Bacillota bacterium]HPZ41802.1 sodium:solute symporter family protein [Bacillota bacterium]HQD52671.1 sodium:solute symporter family protein [Bacillota bacterium]
MQQGAYQYANLVMAGLSIYLLIMLAVGWWSHKQIRNSTDFIIAGRRLPLFLTTGTLFATWFCGGTLMGTAAQSYLFGNQGVIFDPWGSTLSLLLTGLIFARLIRRGGYLTVIDFFDLRYGKKMGLLAALVQVVAEIGWVGGQLVAFGVILQLFAGIPVFWGITLSCAVLIIYTYLGGMWSVTVTDLLQTGMIIAGAAVLLFTVVPQAGGWEHLFASAGNRAGIPARALVPTEEHGYLGYFGLPGWFYYLGAWLSTGLGDIPSQDLAQRLLAAKNERVASWSAIIAAALYLTVGMVPVLLGSIMYGLNPELTIAETEMILPYLAINYLPPVLTVIFAVALVAALMSSSDSALLAASSVIGCNLLRYFKPDADSRLILKVTRLCIPFIAISSLLIACYAQTIYMLAVISWSLILVGLFAPYAAGYFWKKCNQSGAVAALVGGLISWILAIVYLMHRVTMAANLGAVEAGVVQMDWAIWDAVYIGSIPAFAVSVLLMITVSLATQKKDPPRPLVDINGHPFQP